MAANEGRLSRKRRTAVWSLIVGATLIMVVSSLTIWLKRQLLDNGAWTAASAQVLTDPEVRGALSVYLVNRLYENVDVAASLQQRLPDAAKPLATPAAAALRAPAVSAVEFMLQRPRVQSLWAQSSSRAHQKLINVLENKTGYGISTGDGVVTLDLDQLVKEVGAQVGVPDKALARIPPGADQIVLMRSSQLGAAQQAVDLVQKLSVWLMLLALALFAAAVYVARGHRRTTLRDVAWSFVFVGVLVLVVRKLVGNAVADALTSPTYTGSVHQVWLIATSILGEIAWAAIFYGLAGLLAVALAGPSRAARRTRATIAPVLNERPGVTWSATAGLLLLLVLWGGTHALRTWWGIVLIGALLAAGVVALRRETLAEAAAPPTAETAEPLHLPSFLGHHQEEHEPTETYSAAAEIARLQELRSAGAISEEEYARGK